MKGKVEIQQDGSILLTMPTGQKFRVVVPDNMDSFKIFALDGALSVLPHSQNHVEIKTIPD